VDAANARQKSMAPPLPLAELELRIALLSPISRGTHLAGPRLHAERLIELWHVDDDEDVPLAQAWRQLAWRLLGVGAIAGAISRTVAFSEHGYRGDPRHWIFPPLMDLLPELQTVTWQEMLAGELELEAIKGVRGKAYCSVPLLELPRCVPDWELSRLVHGSEDVYVEVRACRRPAEPIKTNWRTLVPIATKDLEPAVEEIVLACAPGEQMSEEDFGNRLRTLTGRPDLPRQIVRNALDRYAPQLRVLPGRRPLKRDT
jgi:hypothetical protein